jgi:hypothetical protein
MEFVPDWAAQCADPMALLMALEAVSIEDELEAQALLDDARDTAERDLVFQSR